MQNLLAVTIYVIYNIFFVHRILKVNFFILKRKYSEQIY